MRKLHVLLALSIGFFSNSQLAFANDFDNNEFKKNRGGKAGFGFTKNFQTGCNPVATFSENFNAVPAPTPGDLPPLPPCWVRVNDDDDATVAVDQINVPPAPLDKALFMRSADDDDDDEMAIVALPRVTNLSAGTHRLRFLIRASNTPGGKIEIGYLTNVSNPSSFTVITTVTAASSLTFQSETVRPSAGLPATAVLAFKHTGDPPRGVYIDDVVWEAVPTCIAPTAITVSSITSTGASLNWTPPATPPTNYQVYISSTNTAPTGATTPTVSGVAAPYTLTGLAANTTYYVWVRSNCGASGTSAWSAVQSFTTACAAVNLPYTQAFEGVPIDSVPPCVKVEDVNGDGSTWRTLNNIPDFTGNVMAYSWHGTNAANDWFYTNGLNLTAGRSYIISYKFGGTFITSTEKMKIAIGTNASSASMATVIADYPAINDNIARVHSIRFTVPSTGVYYIGFQVYSAANQFRLYVDDISVTEAVVAPTAVNTCVPVNAPTIDAQNNTKWMALIDDAGNIIGEINARGNNLGMITSKVYRNSGPVRKDGFNRFYLDRNIEITPTNQPSSPVTVRLYFTAAELAALRAQPGSNVNTFTDISIFKNNDPCRSGVIGGAFKLNTVPDIYGADYVVSFDVSSFSSFYFASSTYSVLPANILTFSGARQGTANHLRWEVAQETDILEYDVERSENGGRSWMKVGNVVSPGNTTANRSYKFTDNTITGLKQLYRLRQVDRAGIAKFSNIISITGTKPTKLLLSGLFPNPAASKLNLLVDAPQKDNITILVVDAVGRIVKSQRNPVETGSNAVQLNVTGLSQGAYFIKVSCDSNCEAAVTRFMKE